MTMVVPTFPERKVGRTRTRLKYISIAMQGEMGQTRNYNINIKDTTKLSFILNI